VLTRAICFVLLLCGCYGKPQLPDVADAPDATAAPSTAPRPTPEPRPRAQAERTAQLAGVLLRLSEPNERPAPERDGAATWRAPELEKLHELLIACCEAGAAGCGACTRQIDAAQLPASEIWPLAGRFLRELRGRADIGLPPLLEPMLSSDDPEDRDRAYRLLVGARVMHRGQLSDASYSAASLPRQPAVGEPLWLIVERIAPCSVGDTTFKGPDALGRVDAVLEPRCDDVPTVDAEVLIPRVHRMVGASRIDALPASGLQIFAGGTPEPLLVLRPPTEIEKSAP
jgi:hypothetical protein